MNCLWYLSLNQFEVICGNELPTRCSRWFFIGKLIVCSTYFGHHYAHHYELKSIIQVAVACGTWCFAAASCEPDTQPTAPRQADNLKTKAPNTTSSSYLYNNLELLMMGIMVPRNMLSKQQVFQ